MPLYILAWSIPSTPYAKHEAVSSNVLAPSMFPVSSPSAHNLSGSAPHVLQETIFLCKSVHRIVALAHGTDEAAKGVDLVLASGTAVLVDLGDGKLDGGVVLGLDDAVGGRALAWDVKVDELSAFVLHFDGGLGG